MALLVYYGTYSGAIDVVNKEIDYDTEFHSIEVTDLYNYSLGWNGGTFAISENMFDSTLMTPNYCIYQLGNKKVWSWVTSSQVANGIITLTE